MKILLSILGEKRERERERCVKEGEGEWVFSVLFFSRFLNMICIWEQQVATLEERPLTVPQFFKFIFFPRFLQLIWNMAIAKQFIE